MVDVLVVAAHPDDEVLGCGGTLARHAAAGDRVQTIFLADGVASRQGGDDAARERRYAAARQAAQALGCLAPVFLGFPDNRLDQVPLLDVIQALEAQPATAQPRIVYTHFGGDLNVDHVIAHRVALTAFRPLPGSSLRAIYGFQTASSTEWAGIELGPAFRPTRYVGIAEFTSHKQRALQAYAEEMRPFPHARSEIGLEAMARLRGSEVGLPAAEAFTVIREIAP